MSERISTKVFEGYKVHAADGEIGHVEELLLDDTRWIARYFVVDVRPWLPGRRVLLPVSLVQEARVGERELSVSIIREQVSECPDIDADLVTALRRLGRKKVSRHWAVFLAGEARTSIAEALAIPRSKATGRKSRRVDNHLRTSRVGGSLGLWAQGERVGCVADFLVDGTSWEVHHLVVDLVDGKRVQLPPLHVGSIDIDASAVTVDLPLVEVFSLTREESPRAREADARLT